MRPLHHQKAESKAAVGRTPDTCRSLRCPARAPAPCLPMGRSSMCYILHKLCTRGVTDPSGGQRKLDEPNQRSGARRARQTGQARAEARSFRGAQVWEDHGFCSGVEADCAPSGRRRRTARAFSRWSVTLRHCKSCSVAAPHPSPDLAAKCAPDLDCFTSPATTR